MSMSTSGVLDEDPTVYPEEERVGEEMLQRWIAEVLRPLLERWMNRPGHGPAFVGADQFIYYRQYDPHRRYAPDVYVLEGVAPTTRVRSWKTWKEGLAPSFALEVVSTDWEKDYCDTPERCAEAGVDELVVFDPSFLDRPGQSGVRWQVFRRTKKKGLRRIERTNDDRVKSRALGCWLRTVGIGDAMRIRIGTGKRGDDLFPTAVEAAHATAAAERAAKEAERTAKEAERTAKEAERTAKEAERTAKEEALARIAQLEAQLAAAKDR